MTDRLCAVIDSGWDIRWAASWIEPGAAFALDPLTRQVVRSGDYHDRRGHGTACSWLVHSVAPGVSVMPIRVFELMYETSAEIVIAAIDFAVARGARFINLSLTSNHAPGMAALYRCCARAAQAGVTIVASAPNNGLGEGFPAAFDCVIGVRGGLLHPSTALIWHEGQEFEVTARGSRVRAPFGAGNYIVSSGSSLAAAIVLGLLAGDPATPMSLAEARSVLRRRAAFQPITRATRGLARESAAPGAARRRWQDSGKFSASTGKIPLPDG